jgi:3-oxoacyl-[acyl-carrier protein] reductase
MDFRDQVVIVTGGSRGIGEATVRAFLSSGARVYSLSRSENESKAELDELAADNGGSFRWLPTDISDPAGIKSSLDTILGEEEGIDVLVNNAGITRDNLLMRMKEDEWDSVLATNLTSAFHVCRTLIRPMIKRRKGAVINVSSVVGITGNGGQSNYSASKAGLIGFTKSLAREVASRGVRVNAVAPGYVETSMTEAMSDQARETLTSRIPLERTGRPEEVAGAIRFLASEDAAYITGHVLVVDGGLAM